MTRWGALWAKKRRRWVAILAIIGALAVCFAAGLFPQQPLRRFVERRLQAALGPSVSLGYLRVVPGGLSAEIRDLVLDTGSLRLEVPRGRMDLSLAWLLARLIPGGSRLPAELKVENLELESPRLLVRAAGAGKGARKASLPSLFVRRIAVTDGALVYADPALAGEITVRGIDIRGGLGRGSLEVSVREGAWDRTAPVPIGPARAELRLSPLLEVEIASLVAQSGRSRLEARGPLGRPGAWAPELALSARLDLSDLGPFGAPSLVGAIDAQGGVSSAADAIALVLDLHGTGLSLAGFRVEDARGKLRYEPGAAASTEWTLGLPVGRVQGETQLRGSALHGGLRFTDVPLETVMRVTAGEPPAGYEGLASGNLSWDGDVRGSVQLNGDARARLLAAGHDVEASVTAAGPFTVPRRSVDLSWDLQTTARPRDEVTPKKERAVGLIEAHLRASGTVTGPMPPNVAGRIEGDASLQGSEGRTTLTFGGTLHSQAGAVGTSLEALVLGGSVRLSAEAKDGVFEQLTLVGDSLDLRPLGASGTARLSLEAKGAWNRLTGSGDLRVEGAAWRGVDLGTVSLAVKSREGNLEASLEVPSLPVRGQARLPVGASALSARLVFDSTRLESFASLWPEGLPIGGALTGRVDLDIPIGRPQDGRAEAQVDALRVQSGEWSVETERPFAVRAGAGRVQVDGLAFAGSGLRLDLSGSLGLEADAPLEVEAAGRVDLGQLPPVPGLTLGGAVEGHVALSGRRARPRATGSITAQALTMEGERVPALTLKEGRIDIEADTAEVRPLTAQVAGGDVTLAGRVPLAAVWLEMRREKGRVGPSEAAALSLTFERVDLAPLVERLRRDHTSPLAGRVSGRLDVAGGLTALGEVRASLDVTPEGISVQDLALQVSPVHLRLENGKAVLADATIAAEGTELTLGGRYDLVEESLDAAARGEMHLRALSPFLKEAALTGRAELDLRISGKVAAPHVTGSLSVHDGTLRLRDLPQALTALEARLVLDGRSVRVEQGSAVLGGGTLTLAGGAVLGRALIPAVDLTLSGKDIALSYPEGLKSRLDVELALTGEPGALQLSGAVRVKRGLYELDLALEKSLLGAVPTTQTSSLLRSIGLDLRVEVVNPVLVRSHLTRLEAQGSLAVLGDLESPAPVGRLELRPGGKVSLQQREFVIESGRLVYSGTWEPEISLRAETLLRGVDLGNLYGRQDVRVKVTIDGPLARPHVSFSSDPGGYSEAEIVSMIATNRAQNEALSSGAWVAGEQTALLLTGRLTRGLAAGLQELGIDEVTIQPELLARETDPGARFTFGKRLTDELRLIYSLSLNDPENRFVELDFNPWRDVSLLAQRREDGSFTLGGGQRLRFFGPPRRPAYREEKVRLQETRIEGDGMVDESVLREMVGVRVGDEVTDWDLQDEAERVRKELREKDHLEAEVAALLDGKSAVFRVTAGPRFSWRTLGMADPPDLAPVIREALFEEEALARGQARLREALYERGHLEAKVEAGAVATDGERTLVFRVAPGPVLRLGAVRFPGAKALSAGRLLEAAGGAARLLAAPEEARRAIQEAYRGRHYLAGEVSPPEVTRRGDEVSITVPIREGPPARVGAVRFRGASRPEEELARVSGIEVGRLYDPALLLEAITRLRDLYFGQGYPNVRIAPRVEAAGTDLEVLVEITEGQRLTVGAIEVVGLRHTNEAFVRRTLGLAVGASLDPRRLAAAERKLLALGVFSRASVTHSGENPVTVRVELEEEARLATQYQLRYNDDRGLSGDLDGEVRNLLGRGLALGARYSRSADEEQIRSSIQLPSLGPFGDLTGSFFHNRQEMPLAEGDGPTLRQLEKGVELQASRLLPNRWNLLYGYRFKTSRVTSDLDDFEVTTKIASLDLSLLRDTRDSPLNARRGRFWSLNLEVAPRALASDLDFVKGLAQLFVSRSFGPGLTWAQGYRLGLAHTFGGERLVFTERFRAGGGNSIRGFATDSLGPRDFLEEPAGGEAVLVFNQELRYMLRFGVGGVVFFDAGNVFARVGDVSFDLRQAVGAGLRWDSPVGLLRLDVGFPLNRQAGEKAYRLHFSLGQAF